MITKIKPILELPVYAGKVVNMTSVRDRLIVITEHGYVYEVTYDPSIETYDLLLLSAGLMEK